MMTLREKVRMGVTLVRDWRCKMSKIGAADLR